MWDYEVLPIKDNKSRCSCKIVCKTIVSEKILTMVRVVAKVEQSSLREAVAIKVVELLNRNIDNTVSYGAGLISPKRFIIMCGKNNENGNFDNINMLAERFFNKLGIEIITNDK